VGQAVCVLEVEIEPVVVFDIVVVLVLDGEPVIVDETRAVAVISGDDEGDLEPTVDRVEVIDAVTVLVEVVVGVICPVPIEERELSDDLVEVLVERGLIVSATATLIRTRPCLS